MFINHVARIFLHSGRNILIPIISLMKLSKWVHHTIKKGPSPSRIIIKLMTFSSLIRGRERNGRRIHAESRLCAREKQPPGFGFSTNTTFLLLGGCPLLESAPTTVDGKSTDRSRPMSGFEVRFEGVLHRSPWRIVHSLCDQVHPLCRSAQMLHAP